MHEPNDIDRRTVLKAVSGATGIVSLGGVSSGEPGAGFRATGPGVERLGTVDLVQIATRYEVAESKHHRRYLVDKTPQFVVRPHEDALLLTDAATPRTKSVVESNDVVSNVGGLSPIAESTRRPERLRMLPVETNPYTYEPARSIALSTAFEDPGVELRRTGGKLALTSGDFETTLQPNAEDTYEIGSGDVTVKAQKVLKGELVENPEIPEHERSLKTERWTETLTATRLIEVRYATDLSVVTRRP